MTVPVLTGDQLRRRLAAGWRPWLVHVGTVRAFADAHLPGAVHVPDPGHVLPLLRAGEAVVLYGDGALRASSQVWATTVARSSPDLLFRYAAGLEEWRSAGGAVEP